MVGKEDKCPACGAMHVVPEPAKSRRALVLASCGLVIVLVAVVLVAALGKGLSPFGVGGRGLAGLLEDAKQYQEPSAGDGIFSLGEALVIAQDMRAKYADRSGSDHIPFGGLHMQTFSKKLDESGLRRLYGKPQSVSNDPKNESDPGGPPPAHGLRYSWLEIQVATDGKIIGLAFNPRTIEAARTEGTFP